MAQQCYLIIQYIPNSKIFSAISSIVFAIGLYLYEKSKLGRQLGQQRKCKSCKILGVDTEKVYATFVLTRYVA